MMNQALQYLKVFLLCSSLTLCVLPAFADPSGGSTLRVAEATSESPSDEPVLLDGDGKPMHLREWTPESKAETEDRAVREQLKELADAGNFADIIPVATNQLRSDPTSAEIWRYRGWAYLQAKDYQRCIYDLTQSINRDATPSLLAWRLRSVCYRKAGQAAKALFDANKAVGIDSDDLTAYWVRADAYKDLRNCPKANADYLAACASQRGAMDNACSVYWCGESEENLPASVLNMARSINVSRDHLRALRQSDNGAAERYIFNTHNGYINHFMGLRMLFANKYGVSTLQSFLQGNGIWQFPFY